MSEFGPTSTFGPRYYCRTRTVGKRFSTNVWRGSFVLNLARDKEREMVSFITAEGMANWVGMINNVERELRPPPAKSDNTPPNNTYVYYGKKGQFEYCASAHVVR